MDLRQPQDVVPPPGVGSFCYRATNASARQWTRAHVRDHVMRLSGLSPCFAPEAPDGASRFTGQLALALGAAGIGGQWLATTASGAAPTSAWSNRWTPALPPGDVACGRLTVTRFAARDPLPRLAWRITTRVVFTVMQPRLQRASERAKSIGPRAWQQVVWPVWAERYVLAGLGPHAPGLLAAFRDALRDADAALIAYPPLGLAARACHSAERLARPVALVPLFHQEDPLNSLPTWVRLYQEAAAILALTEAEAQTFRDLFHHANVHVVGAGVDVDDLLAPTISGQRFRDAQGLDTRPFALYLGRKEGGKNYRMAIDAVRQARAMEPAARDLTLVMIGGDVDRRPIDHAEALYLGPLSRAQALDALDACTVLINPSTSESFGLTLLEAWARRKPVLAHGGCAPFRSIVTDGVDGWLAADVTAMAARLGQVVANPTLARAMGEAGFDRLNKLYTWPVVADRVLKALASPHFQRHAGT